MKLGALFSGGKDSTYAAFWAMAQGHEAVLLTVRPEPYSMMFHHPNIDCTKLQAEAMELQQKIIEAKEEDWEEKLINALKQLKAEAVVGGAVASEYQRRRFEKVCEELGIPAYAPLWHKGRETLDEMIEYMEIYITAVAAEGLGKEWLGKKLNELLEKKPKNVDAFLEGGEGETFVADAPFFRKRIVIKNWNIEWDGIRGTAKIRDAELQKKT